jgi:hypothetical protein
MKLAAGHSHRHPPFLGGIEDEHEDDDENDFANAFFKQPLSQSSRRHSRVRAKT